MVARVQGEGGGGWEVAMVIKGQKEGSLWWWKCSASWPYHCQYSYYDIILYWPAFTSTMLPLGEKALAAIFPA